MIVSRLVSPRIGAALRATWAARLAAEVARFAFYVGLPYAALLTGAFTPRDVGLQGSPQADLILGWTPEAWARTAGQAVVLIGLALVAIGLLAWQVRRAGGYPPLALGIERASIARSIRDGVYAEAHWSFYRAIPMALLGDAHWTAVAGLVLVSVEAALAGRVNGPAGSPLLEALMAALSAAFFAATGGNVWVAIVVQISVRAAATAIAYRGRDAASSTEMIV